MFFFEKVVMAYRHMHALVFVDVLFKANQKMYEELLSHVATVKQDPVHSRKIAQV